MVVVSGHHTVYQACAKERVVCYGPCTHGKPMAMHADPPTPPRVQPLISQSGFVPLFSSVISRTGIDDIFCLQCCGWDGGDTPGTGTLVLGGIDESFYTGAMSWMPIISETYYCVGLICASTPPAAHAAARRRPPTRTSMPEVMPDLVPASTSTSPLSVAMTAIPLSTQAPQA